MADFILVNELTEIRSYDNQPIDMPIWISKYHVKRLSDNHTSYTIITYDNGQEIKVRESVREIIAMFNK